MARHFMVWARIRTRTTLFIYNKRELDAAMAHRRKSAKLITAILNFVVQGVDMTYAEADATMLALMGEPRLSRDNLLTVARTLYRSAGSGVAHNVRLALCEHRLADTEVIATALWAAAPATTRAIGVSLDALLPAVVWWVRRRGLCPAFTSNDRHPLIVETVARWDAWAGAGPGRRAFLLTSSFELAGADCTEADMFAAGAALLTTPAQGRPART